jgi:hypothetical protein
MGNQLNFAEFASHCDRVSHEHLRTVRSGEGRVPMSSRSRRSIGSATFICVLLVSSLGVGGPADAQSPVDCLPAPKSASSQNSHWYYRTNRTTQRKCWRLHTTDQSSPQRGVQTAHDEATSNSLQSRRANLSDKEATKLYADFLEWRKRHVGY